MSHILRVVEVKRKSLCILGWHCSLNLLEHSYDHLTSSLCPLYKKHSAVKVLENTRSLFFVCEVFLK